MKRILTTTAIAIALATPISAQNDDPTDWSATFQDVAGDNDIHASEFIGSRVYVSESDVEDTAMNEAGDNWEDIGEISDVLMTRDGDVEAILVDVGGFLGIGEKTVAVQMDRLRLVSDGDSPGDYFVVFTSSREALENAPEFQEMDERAEMGADDSAANDTMAADETPDDDMRTPGTFPAAPEFQMEGYGDVGVQDLTAEDLTGATVYDINNENIGDISDLIVDSDGIITDAIIDVGGFLGIGEKPVRVGFDSLTVKRADNDGEVRVYIDATEDQLEELPQYDG